MYSIYPERRVREIRLGPRLQGCMVRWSTNHRGWQGRDDPHYTSHPFCLHRHYMPATPDKSSQLHAPPNNKPSSQRAQAFIFKSSAPPVNLLRSCTLRGAALTIVKRCPASFPNTFHHVFEECYLSGAYCTQASVQS
jgi:hypothetical protein